MKTLQTFLIGMLLIPSFILAQQKGYKAGDKAIDFKLLNIDGKMVSLSDYSQSKGFIVVFTCNHCPFAKAYEQRIIDLHQKFSSQGYPVIAINSNDKDREPEDSYENMQVRAKEKNYPFVYLYDQTQEIAKTYGAMRTPDVYLLKKDNGEYHVMYTGTIDDNFDEPEKVTVKYVDDALQAVMKGQPVALKNTKAIGCSIKWKKK